MPSNFRTSNIPSSLTPEIAPQGVGLESDDLSFRQAIRTVRKRRSVVLWSVLAIGISTFTVSLLLRPYYSSTATIEIERQQNDLGASSLGELAGSLTGEDDVKTEIQTEVSVLESDDLGIETIERTHFEDHQKRGWSPFGKSERSPEERGLPLSQAPKTRERLLKEFEKRLTITPIPDTRLIQVIFEDPDPRFAADTANILIDQYVQDRLGRRNSSTVQATGWMTGEIGELKKQVQAAEQKLIDYQRQSGLIVVPSTLGLGSGQTSGAGPAATSPVLDRLTQLNTSLIAAEANRISQEALYNLAKSGDLNVLSNMAVGMQTSGSEGSKTGVFDGLLALRQQETSLKLQLASALQTYGPKNPHLVDLDKQLETLNQQMKLEMKRALNTTEMNYKVAKGAEDGIRKAFDEEEQKAYKMNDSEIRLAVLQQEADSTRALYQDLYTKLQESQLSEGTQSSNIAMISRALPEDKPRHPKKVLNTAIGVLVGLVLGIIATFIFDTLDDSIGTSAEAERLTGIPVLAAIPIFNPSTNPLTGKPAPGPQPQSAESPRDAKSASQAGEAFRALRTAILLSQAGSPPRTLMLASALPGEGKTTTCFGLGACFAILGNRVLLIDADLRRPTLHRHMDIPNNLGLSNLLSSTSDPSKAIFENIHIKNLFILPAGSVPPNPSELLGSKEFDILLQSLSEQYDIVLIDTPPAMVVTDAFSISVKVDGIVVVVRSGSTTRSALQRIVERFHRNNANVLGLVLNAVNTQSPEYYYDQGYYGRDYPIETDDDRQEP